MELADAIKQFREALAEVEKQGQTSVPVANIKGYLDGLEVNAEQSKELRRIHHEKTLAYDEAVSAQARENFKAVINAGKEAINAVIIINGGAVIALLSFMGNAAGEEGAAEITAKLSGGLLSFTIGVLLGALSFGTRYVAQFLYAYHAYKPALIGGHCMNAVSWIVTIGGYFAFLCAAIQTYSALQLVG